MAHHHYEDVIDTSKKKQTIDLEIEKLQSEKAQIEKAEEIKNTKALELSNELKSLKETKQKLEKEIIRTRKELNKLCTHERVRSEESYSPGSYLNTEEYITTYYCDICGVEVDRKVKHGSFG